MRGDGWKKISGQAALATTHVSAWVESDPPDEGVCDECGAPLDRDVCVVCDAAGDEK